MLEGGEEGLIGQFAVRRLGDAKINHLGHGHAVVHRDQDVRGLDVPVNDAFLVRVLDGPANLNEQIQPLPGGKIVLVAVIGDLDAAHQFHDEIRPAGFRGAGVQHLGDVRMVHQCQRLPLGFKTGDDILGVHAQLDDFEGHQSANGFLLLGHIDHPAAAFTDLLEQFVMADPVANFLAGTSFQIVGRFGSG